MNERRINHSNRKTLKRKNKPLRDIELRIIAELMKNSRRSDREIAKTIGISQATVSRIIRKLEKIGAIKEYTVIPDFHMLGYEILALARFDMPPESHDDGVKARETMLQTYPLLIATPGISLERNRVHVGFFRNYNEYTEAMRFLKAIPRISVDKIDTFLADLSDKKGFRFMSMSAMANHLLKSLKDKGEKYD